MRHIALLMLAVGAAACPASADLLEFTMSGTVDVIFGAPPAPWSDVALGNPMTIRYTFESSVPDLDPGNPFSGTYDALRSFTLTVGALTLDAPGFGVITVWNDFDVGRSDYMDYYRAVGLFPGTVRVYPALTDSLFKLSPDALSSDSLPTDLHLAPWDTADIFVEAQGGIFWANIDTFERRVVPCPPGAMLLLLVGIRRRRGADARSATSRGRTQ